MPNWTTNTWSLSGEQSELDKVREAIKPKKTDPEKKIFDFNVFIPTPKELEKTSSPVKVVDTEAEAKRLCEEAANSRNSDFESETPIVAISEAERKRRMDAYGAEDWYEFHNLFWGVKWEGTEVKVLRDEPGELVLSFNTAWSAPTPIAAYLQNRGLTLVGGGIYEDGSELEIIGAGREEFDKIFKVEEEKVELEIWPGEDPVILTFRNIKLR